MGRVLLQMLNHIYIFSKKKNFIREKESLLHIHVLLFPFSPHFPTDRMAQDLLQTDLKMLNLINEGSLLRG